MGKTSSPLQQYYSERAEEYDDIYARPDKERLQEQAELGKLIAKNFQSGSILEIACGTGYWTTYLANPLTTIFSTDGSKEMLSVAQKRFITQKHKPFFFISDAYHPLQIFPGFDGAFAGCWFSHVPKQKVSLFLKNLQARLQIGAPVMFLDNVLRSDLGGELKQRKSSHNTWKKRQLKNGKEFSILKNYFSEEELREIFAPFAKSGVHITYGKHFWSVSYQYNGQ